MYTEEEVKEAVRNATTFATILGFFGGLMFALVSITLLGYYG